MEHCFFIARSLTHAQRMVRALARCGVRSIMFRAGASLSKRGCAYAVRLRGADAENARRCLASAGIEPLDVVIRRSE